MKSISQEDFNFYPSSCNLYPSPTRLLPTAFCLLLSQRHGRGVHDFAQDGFRLVRLLHGGKIAGADDAAMGENGDHEFLAIVGDAVGAAFHDSHGLGGAVK